ncbi:MAG: hypothetical protein A3B99_03055 [Candidatus Yanofskybacteria bacterium RIFCSPHIGHO2_02_FULL_44_12b]|uniref:Uncharacterized protein n=2 Tax=Candidatus Yanofskyibacteriota TaxID=1752733 RepID=A0A1F8GME4_9BACT|nr:MAG: hypothetical protein UW79_C0005G0026 [Candidatus Yanofskybacteria bacterium GW2011_GWA2_44_9]OGN05503.1 MAG: hypothetical protein A2659_02830 [Candidatus Yanofskybacteria bacterium RIFCSPHIGHO2_01_FULL_44_24]OGN15054.1 MAG: hypothetical protein A3B99_03055 [Candidatus Yanofskybacteria bacterium RIFCSPHIGHO2_02_FULL_44_12b]OGN26523.1 MAG: hypothetical protein A2925_03200 [Candidatus Yanofskybacteria bacterium RIFCSPLOWO2_01_FULL_44_22]
MGQNKILLIIIILLGLVAGYFYYTEAAGEPDPPIPLPIDIEKDDLKSAANINLDFSVFENETYKTLIQFGESPVKPGNTGKTNVFAPIE